MNSMNTAPLHRPLPASLLTGNARVMGGVQESPVLQHFAYIASPCPQAGFPSPAADYVEESIDLNRLLISNPPATFLARIQGDSLKDRGLLDGDVVVVDRSQTPMRGKVVVASFDGDLYIKVLRRMEGRLALCSENAERAREYPPMFLDEDEGHVIWGVVTGAVRTF